MPQLSDASRRRRRETIAAAAMRCFARDGFANTSMADIISEAGSSAGSVYSNFSSKADLVRFAASNTLQDLVATLGAEVPSERTPASVLAHLLRSSSDTSRAQTLVQIWAEVPRDPDLEEFARQSLLELRSIVQTALLPWCRDPARRGSTQPEAVADAVTDAVLTVVQGYLVRVTVDRDVDADLLASRVVSVFDNL